MSAITYQKQKILIVTRHQKQTVIAPAFKKYLKSEIITTEHFDTDQFGTFDGEINRVNNAEQTCLIKAKTAAQQLGYDLAIASEGSFGPHPTIPFIPGAIEIISLVDLKNDVTFSEYTVTEKTNYTTLDFKQNESYQHFLKKAQFPEHAVILKSLDPEKVIAKGITDPTVLNDLIKHAFKQHKQLRLETDMRAMYNPTRMQVIAELAEKFAQRLSCHCPACHNPGFGTKKPIGQLLCEDCGTTTTLYKQISLLCQFCNYQSFDARPDGLTQAPVQYCPRCNP